VPFDPFRLELSSGFQSRRMPPAGIERPAIPRALRRVLDPPVRLVLPPGRAQPRLRGRKRAHERAHRFRPPAV
jgi:hypothetical protein